LEQEKEVYLYHYTEPLEKGKGEAFETARLGIAELSKNNVEDAEIIITKSMSEGLDGDALASAKLLLGFIYLQKGQIDVSADCFFEAVEIFKSTGNQHGKYVSLFNLGVIRRVEGDYEASFASFLLALEIADELDDFEALDTCLAELADTATGKGDFDEALRCREQAVEASLEAGMMDRAAINTAAVGNLLRFLGRNKEAIEKFNGARSFFEDANNSYGVAACLDSLSSSYLAEGMAEEALMCCDNAVRLFAALKDEQGEADAMFSRGMALCANQNVAEGIENIQVAMEKYSSWSDTTSVGNCLCEIANIYSSIQQHENAIEYFRKGAEAFLNAEDDDLRIDALLGMGSSLMAVGDVDSAITIFEECAECHRKDADEKPLADILQHLASALYESGDSQSAVSRFEEAKNIYARLGDEEGVRMAEKNIEYVKNRNIRS
jgi:tetratricopeptide (TPR) repeat protein